ncbi:MAG: rRNA pseudouridine synthase, partial [Verrucomicrobiota bacterium]|nr:rRNA pseudouridine synthase [Verrucomicrobiota bacterium]
VKANPMRLNRYLAAAGLGSRRSVEELIRGGRVRINGRVVVELATRVEPGDSVKVGGRVIQAQETLSAVLYKPRGYLCTASDERNRRTIFELLPSTWPRVFHVGRLDKESEGLLIVTNDGELSLAVTHPRYKIEKEYEAGIDQPLDPAHREKLLRGFHIPGGRARVERVDLLAPRLLRIILMQGIKRQVRLMLYELGYEVTHLRRTRIGPLKLGRLKPGEWRMLSPREIAQLKTGETRAMPMTKAQGSSTKEFQ